VEVGNYKILRRGGILRLCMTINFNTDRIDIDIARNVMIKNQHLYI